MLKEVSPLMFGRTQTIKKISTTKAIEIEDGVKYALKYFAKPSRNLIKEFLSAY